jgi:hypothetical protein
MRTTVALATVASSVGLLAGAATAGPPGTWTQITRQINGANPNVGLARAKDGTLHVLWAGPGRAPYTSILDTPISPAGAVGNAQSIVSGWANIHQPTAATGPDGSIHVVDSADKANSNTDPNSGLNEFVGPGSWTIPAQAFGNGASIAEADNADVRMAILKSGQLASVWLTAAKLFLQVGVDPGTPPQDITPDGLGSNPVIAVDEASGDAVIAYKGVKDGTQFFRRVQPSLGPPVAIPQTQKIEGVQIAARAGGGVYTAYTPDFAKVWLVRFGGQPRAVPVPKGAQVNTAGVATGPDGRLWVYYGNGQTTWVTRTSKSTSGWEPVQVIKNPAGIAQYFRIEGEGSAGPLDLFVDLVIDGQQKDGTYHTQVHPALSLQATAKAGRVTVRVTDAGDPVAGAKVTGLPGGAKTTDAKGAVTVPVRKKGALHLTATKAGYVTARGGVSA